MRNYIIEQGGEFLFECKLVDFQIENDRLVSARYIDISKENSEVKSVILFALEFLRDRDMYSIEKLKENVDYYNNILKTDMSNRALKIGE